MEFLLLGAPGHGRSSFRDSVDVCYWTDGRWPEPGVRPYTRWQFEIIHPPSWDEQIREVFRRVPAHSVLVVSALEGLTQAVRKLLAFGKRLGQPPPLVWLSKADLAEPEELALAELDVRELYAELAWDAPVIVAGSVGRPFRHVVAAKRLMIEFLDALLDLPPSSPAEAEPGVEGACEFRAVVLPCDPDCWLYWEQQGCPPLELIARGCPDRNEALLLARPALRFPSPVMDAELCLSQPVVLSQRQEFALCMRGHTLAAGRLITPPE